MAKIRAFRIARRARKPYFGGAIMTEIKRTIERDVKKDVIKRFEAIVRDWEHKPKFILTTAISRGSIELWARAAGKNAKIWHYVSRGTRRHKITAKRGKTLAFKWGGPGSYAPKTTVGPPPTWGGPGRASGKMVYPQSVVHPGFEGRHFEEWVASKEGPRFQGRVSAAIRRGINKSRKEAGWKS